MSKSTTDRDVIFITKATPEDNEFTEWLAPRLEAAGYKVFADILNLEAGERWRKTPKPQNPKTPKPLRLNDKLICII